LTDDPNDAAPALSAALIEAELARIGGSELFRRSQRHRQLLRHLVLHALAGDTGRLKESVLAAEIFGIDPARFDPARESIVRVEARRLRLKLARYYAGPGADTPLRFVLEAGSYVPRIQPVAAPGRTAGALPAFAVLPFLDLVGDERGEARADTLSEELIDALVQFPGIKVVARTSSFRFKGQPADVREIGRVLGVDALIEGSIQRRGDGYRVIAQLIDVADGMHRWSHAFEVDTARLDDVVLRLAQRVAGDFFTAAASRAPLRRIAWRASADAGVNDAFARGKYLLGRHSLPAYRNAVAAFDEAVAIDPGFALGWVAKAQAHLAVLGMSAAPNDDDIDAAHLAVSRALELDAELGAAHATAAQLAFAYGRDWIRAERAAQQAIRYAPGNAYVHHSRGWMLMFSGRFAEARQAFAVARELDPLDPQLEAHQRLVRFYERDYDGAAADFARVLQKEPANLVARVLWATSVLCAGRASEALRQFEAIAADLPGDSIGPLGVVQALAVGGDLAAARAAFVALVERFGEDLVGPYRMAMAAARLGDADAAFAWLERAATARDFNFVCTAVDPTFDPLRDDPRWTLLLARHRLPRIDPRTGVRR
jgi:TolB-like protein/tetratricopeptide (TPR) repeat protein